MPGPLDGLRVVDRCDRSGLFCGRLLAQLGAEVVLIEPPGGHPWRTADEDGRAFAFYAAGRRSRVIDPALAADRLRLDELIARADVLLETGPPGRVTAFHAAHPHLVVASITPFGESGPRCGWRANDLVAQALGGMACVNGHANGPPLRAVGLQAYHQAGIFAVIGILAALRVRRHTGRGQVVDVSLQAAVAGALEHVPGLFHQTGIVSRRQGTLHWTRFFAVVGCRGGQLLVSTLGDWTSLREWLRADGHCPEDLDDPAWENAPHRRDHAERLFDILSRWAAERDVHAVAEGAQLRRLPFAVVRAPAALLSDEHLVARGFASEAARPEGAPAFRLSGWTRLAEAPHLGEPAAPAWPARPHAARSHASARGRPLQAIRVLDFTWVVAGPVATRLLADLGAEVVKVERRQAQDFGDRRGGLSGTLMRGKRSIGIDLAREEGRELARALARRSDVVIDNYSARVMDNLGLDYEALRVENPGLVMVRMTGFGLVGPHRDQVSYGPTLQASTGYTLLIAEPGKPPAGFGYSYSDLASGNLGALAVLAALEQRERTGEGQLIDFAQLEAAASLLGPIASAVASGNASQEGSAAPHGIYPTQEPDGWIAIAVEDDHEWRALTTVLGTPAWATSPHLATRAGRLLHVADLDRSLGETTRRWPRMALMEALQTAGVPAGVVADAKDLCADDPQLRARGHFVDCATPEGRTVRLDGPPFVLSETPAAVGGPGPLLGEHTDEILRELLGRSADQIAALRSAGVVF